MTHVNPPIKIRKLPRGANLILSAKDGCHPKCTYGADMLDRTPHGLQCTTTRRPGYRTLATGAAGGDMRRHPNDIGPEHEPHAVFTPRRHPKCTVNPPSSESQELRLDYLPLSSRAEQGMFTGHVGKGLTALIQPSPWAFQTAQIIPPIGGDTALHERSSQMLINREDCPGAQKQSAADPARHPKRWTPPQRQSRWGMPAARGHPKYTHHPLVPTYTPLPARHPNDSHHPGMTAIMSPTPTSSTKRRPDCYAPKQSAGRRVSGQRETPRVGLENRVWGLKKPESDQDCHRLDSGGIRLARSVRGCACPVNVPGGVGIPR